MKHEGTRRRTQTDYEGLNRRARRKVIAEDYDDDDFSDSYDVVEQEAESARLVDDTKPPSPDSVR